MLGLTAVFLATTAPDFGQSFWQHWGDGQAEVSAYDYQITRYGEARTGVLVAIFVTETFSEQHRTKVPAGHEDRPDSFPVMKLNWIADFPTGVYDYNTMTSSFVALTERLGRPPGSTAKISFSSQEWCGHTYQQLLPQRGFVQSTMHSYFEGEGDASTRLAYPASALFSDTLWHWARGMHTPIVKPGEQTSVPLLNRMQEARLLHEPLKWQQSNLQRGAETQTIQVPAGTFETVTATVSTADDKQIFWIEAARPHRVVRWQHSRGESAELLGSKRMKYWELQERGQEALLQSLGLSPRPPRTP